MKSEFSGVSELYRKSKREGEGPTAGVVESSPNLGLVLGSDAQDRLSNSISAASIHRSQAHQNIDLERLPGDPAIDQECSKDLRDRCLIPGVLADDIDDGEGVTPARSGGTGHGETLGKDGEISRCE